MNLFLDDIRDPKDISVYLKNSNLEWIIVRSYDEFVKYITDNDMPELISFDHDLADEHYTVGLIDGKIPDYKEKTGYEALKWLCNYSLDNKTQLPEIKFHTANYIGWKNMFSYLNNFIKHNPEMSKDE